MQPNTYITRIVAILPPLLEDMLAPQLALFLKGLPDVFLQRSEVLSGLERQEHLDFLAVLGKQQVSVVDNLPKKINQHIQAFVSSTLPKVAEPAVESSSLELVDFSDIEITLEKDKAAARVPAILNPILADAFLRLNSVEPLILSEAQMPFHPRELISIVVDCFANFNLTLSQETTIINAWHAIANFTPLKDIIPAVLLQANVPKLKLNAFNRRTTDRAVPSAITPSIAGSNLSQPIKDVTPFMGGQPDQALTQAAIQRLQTVDQPIFAPPVFASHMPASMPQGSSDFVSGPVQVHSNNGSIVLDPAALMQQAFLFAKISNAVAAAPLAVTHVSPLAEDRILMRSDLDSLLSRLQLLEREATGSVTQNIAQVETIRQSICEQLTNNDETCDSIDNVDQDSINLVSMLFECIFADNHLPNAMKVLLSRLQIPFVRIAIMDKAMFAQENHPARLLLNQMAKAALGWDANNFKTDAVYKKLEEIVVAFLDEFNGDIAVIDRLLQALESFLQAHQLSLAAVEGRTANTAENLAKAALFRQVVQEELNERLEQQKLPFAVVKILQEGWRNVLYQAAIRQGLESEAWKKSLKIVDALIWSMQPDASDDNWVGRLKILIPKLMNSLRKGLASVNYDTLQSNTLLSEIENLHQEIIAGAEIKTVQLQSSMDGNTAGMKKVEEVLSSNAVDTQFLVLPETDFAKLYRGDTLPDDHPCVRTVRFMPVGTWVDFIHPNEVNRYKFVARIRSTEKLIFTNQRGIKVAETPEMQFAIDLNQARASIVDTNSEVFDRALKVMVNRINANAA